MTLSAPEPTPSLTDDELEAVKDARAAEADEYTRQLRALPGWCRACPPGCNSCLGPDCECYEHNELTTEGQTQMVWDLQTKLSSAQDEAARLRAESAELAAARAELSDAMTVAYEAMNTLSEKGGEAIRERDALAAKLDQFRSFPTDPGPGAWSTSYRMGYADAGRDVRAVVRALDNGQSLRERWESATTPPEGGTDGNA